MSEDYRRLRAEEQIIRDAAAALRHDAVQDQYAGRVQPELAYGAASLWDLIALHYADLPVHVREHAAGLCVWTLEERARHQNE